jgi:hypothetical protein
MFPVYERIEEEVAHRKRATELKKQKLFRAAASEMWLSFKALKSAGQLPALENLYRYPKYLFMAGDYAECAVACEKMAVGEPFGNLGSETCDCQRTRMFFSLAADAYEAMGNTDLANRYRSRVEKAGSDNQAYVDRQVGELVANGFTIGMVRDDCDSEHPAYEKLKGKLIRLTETEKRRLPLYADVRATGLFADDDYPVGVFPYDGLLDSKTR